MDNINKVPSEVLRTWQAILNHQEKPAIERLATLACIFLDAVIEQELATRPTKPEPQKGKGKS